MGQYYKIVNTSKGEFLNGHDYGDGIKLMEFGMSGQGTMAALAGLLVLDAQMKAPWAGCSVVVAGDYADEGRFLPRPLAGFNLYSAADGYHLEKDAEQSGGATPSFEVDDLPPMFRAAFHAVQPSSVNPLLKGMGLNITLGSRDSTTYECLTNPEFVVEQPEDLWDALDCYMEEHLPNAVAGLLRSLRMSAHQSDVAWLQPVTVTVALDPESQGAQSMTVTLVNPRALPKDPDVPPRTLKFPATQKDLCKFFGVDAAPKLLASN